MLKTLPFILAVSLALLLFSCNTNTDKASVENTEETEDAKGIRDALEFEFMITKNPVTGKIPEGIRELEMAQARSIAATNNAQNRISANSYSFQGPDNLGGRTRSVVFDTRYNGTTNRVILAAGISGGVWKSTDGGLTWVRKSPPNVHYSCTSLAQDTRTGQQDTWYYATGEFSGNSAGATGAFYTGNGVFKSSDNGETWTRLANSNTSSLETFSVAQDLITKIAVHPVTGHIYIAALASIIRSVDGGATWATVLSGTLANSGQATDLAISSTGKIYAGFGGTNTSVVDGVWTSSTGNLNEWTKLAGTGANTTPAGWNAQNTYGRLVLAITPGNENIVYALYAKTTASDCAGTPAPEAEFFRLNLNSGVDTVWTDLSANLPDETGCSNGNDPFAVQGGYDMVVAIHPTNPNLVLIGGTNVYRSTSGFTNTTNTTRIGGYASPANYALYTNSHPDIHAIVFDPVVPNGVLCGNDGGIQRTADVTTPTVAWTNISNGFRTYQYYYVDIDPRAGNNKVIGGAQDNGTTRNIGGAGMLFESVFGGDGVSVGLSNEIGGNTYEYVGSQSGNISRRTSTSGQNFGTNIRPISTNSNGLFVTLFHLNPDNSEQLYYVNLDTIYRTVSASTVTRNNWDKLTGVSTLVAGSISALATTRGQYTTSHNLFFGNSLAQVFRLTDPANVAVTTPPVNITGSNFPATGYISSIATNPRNDDTVLVTLSNYGVVSAFWTGNAKSATPTWVNVEGNLTLPSYRSSSIAIINGQARYFVGTSAGLFSTTIDAANAATTAWVQESANDIGNAVIANLKLRPADNILLVGTHGYGMWKAELDPSALPVTFLGFTGVAEKNHNVLTWSVSNETNSKGYSIERWYKDQLSFSPVGYVASKGTGNNSAAIYNFKDLATGIPATQTLYRLKQEDKDGHSKYSAVVTINRKASAQLVDYISANSNTLLVRMNNSITNEKLSLRITDINGRQLIKRDGITGNQEIPISQLSSGAYLVEILAGSERVYLQKFVK